MSEEFPTIRPRRLRRTGAMRRMVAETRIDLSSLVLPLFVRADEGVTEPIPSLPGHYQWSVDRLPKITDQIESAGVGGVMLFGIPETKEEEGSSAWDPNGPVPRAIATIKDRSPDLVVWADVCLCEYTSHGHCGVVVGETIDNDATLPLLTRAATVYADAGADIIAPSDMMDGRVGAIRTGLDEAGHHEIAICSYAVKYASAYYGPFRDAAGSTPAFGDRRSHQMDPPNRREALIEVDQDLREGADMVMVKPAGPYLDVVSLVADHVNVPVVAYSVSGEYAAIKAAAANGWLDGDAAMREAITGVLRAGANIVLTYAALEL